MQQPPSFAPQGQTNEDVEEANDDLADTRLFGKYTTATVVVVAAAVVVLVALGIALGAVHLNSKSNNPDTSNEWSDSNIDNVPFGDENGNSGNGDSSSQSSNKASGEAEYDYIDVTDLFFK